MTRARNRPFAIPRIDRAQPMGSYGVPNHVQSAGEVFTVVASATPNTNGTPVEVSASLPTACQWVTVALNAITAANASASQTIMEICTGGSGSEVAVLGGIQLGWRPQGSIVAELPLVIAAGERVSIRTRSAVASKSVAVSVIFSILPPGTRQIPTATPMGVHGTLSQGTTLGTPGANDGTTFGAWTELTAATVAAYRALRVSPGLGAQSSVPLTTYPLVQIGVGGSGSETAIATFYNGWETPATNEILVAYCTPVVDVHIPTGTRLSARYTRTAATAFDLIVHGIA